MKKRMNFARALIRNAGRSCEWKIRKNFFCIGAAAGAFAAALLMLIFGNIGGLGFAVMAGTAYAAYHFLGETPEYFRGLEGKERVGEELEPLIRSDCHVLSDISGDGFNIDFLLIGPSGIYVIEVRNTPGSEGEKISYDGENIFLGGRVLNNPNPAAEARNRAFWVRRYLKAVKETDENIKPVVLFPDAEVANDETCVSSDLWILNPGRFRDHYLPGQKQVFSAEKIKEILSVFRVRVRASRSELAD